ncbi:hypothetical protein ACVIW2_002376 [Bradyrhizobium huanghuaihaiense]
MLATETWPWATKAGSWRAREILSGRAGASGPGRPLIAVGGVTRIWRTATILLALTTRRTIMLTDSYCREHRPIADFKFLKNVV